MDQNYHKIISKGSKTIQLVTKLKGAMNTQGAHTHVKNKNAKDNKEVAQNNRKDLLSQEPLTPTTHRPSFPTHLLHPRRVHLH
jgi:hypothetical protein